MIAALLQSAVAVAVLILVQWKTLQKGDKATRWLSRFFVVLAGGIYWYTQTHVHVPHPSIWLDTVFRPWSPVN